MGTIEQAPVKDRRTRQRSQVVEYIDRTGVAGVSCEAVDKEQLVRKIDALQSGENKHFWAPEGQSATEFTRRLAHFAASVYHGPVAVVHATAAVTDPLALSRLGRSDAVLAFVNYEGASDAQRAALETVLGETATPVIIDVFPTKQT